MNTVFLGGLIPPQLKLKLEFYNDSLIQYAAEALQQEFIQGLQLNNLPVTIISAPFITPYPKSKNFFHIESEKFTVHGMNSISVSFCNLSLIRLYSKYKNIYKQLKKISPETIIIYSIHSPLLKAAYKYKTNNKGVKIVLIVPDLPEFMSESKNILYLTLKRIDKYYINKYLNTVDKFVLLSDYMYNKLPIHDKDWVRIEGICSVSPESNIPIKANKTTFLYTGTLDKRYNILDLIEAFIKLNDKETFLWICGTGNCEEQVKQYANEFPNIIYFGQVTRKEVLMKQKTATILINPRKPDLEFTRYSFPSKTMEYLASGTPLLMYKLPSIPKEYDEHILYIEDLVPIEDNYKLYESMKKVVRLSQLELEEKGKIAQKFVLSKKTSKEQVKKMLKLF